LKKAGKKSKKNKIMAETENFNVVPVIEIPFRTHAPYRPEEMIRIHHFMHESFPHLTYGGGRDKKTVVEYPPEEICGHDKWKEVLDTVLKPELETLDLNLRRKTKIIVRFAERLHDYDLGTNFSGSGMPFKNRKEQWFRISYIGKDGKARGLKTLIYILMHELTEADFWAKTNKYDPDMAIKKVEGETLENDRKAYRHLADEETAHRRAWRAIKRMWPDEKWDSFEKEFEENR
jgi:hypothetical protein